MILHSNNFFSCHVLNINSLKCISKNNQECKIRSEIISVNPNEPTFYSNSIIDLCNTINDPIMCS